MLVADCWVAGFQPKAIGQGPQATSNQQPAAGNQRLAIVISTLAHSPRLEVSGNRRFLNSAYPAAHLPRQRNAIDVASQLTVVTEAAPGGGMQNSRSSPVVEHSLQVVALSRPLVEAVQRRDRDLASQLRRAISSIALNLSEGFGAGAGNARLRFESALGLLNEAKTAIRVAAAWGYFSSQSAQATLDELNVLGGRIVGLVRR